MQAAGLATLMWRRTALYPRLTTSDFDLFLGQTPFPGRVSEGTRILIRYHDTIPILMPQTTRGDHYAAHFRALQSNVRDGAWFACVSETTRSNLLRLFPEASARAVTIHNMVSHHYFVEGANLKAVTEIVRSKSYRTSGWLPTFRTIPEENAFYERHIEEGSFRYLLMVSTIEPRKNHTRLIAAWNLIKAEYDPNLKLVIVGTLGWGYESVRSLLAPQIARGEAFMLHAVPADDLRLLYRNALATICPSLGEGFGFSGVEAMRSGGIAIASDIPVHREIYADAAIYFDPYSTASLTEALAHTLYSEHSGATLDKLRQRGREVGDRYLPDNIIPKWERFLMQLTNKSPEEHDHSGLC